MQRILIIITLALIVNISCNSKSKKKKDFEPTKIEDIVQQGHFKTLWTRKLEKAKKAYGYRLEPFIDNQDVFVASQDGVVTNLSVANGQTSWSVKLDSELSAGPGVGSDILVLGTPDGYVIALNKSNGNQIWSIKLSSEIITPPVINNQVVIVRAQDGRVFALDSQNGERKWLFDTNIPNLTLRGNSKPVVKAGRVYIGFDNGKVAAIKQESGDVIWLQNVVKTKGKTELARIVDIDGDMELIATDLYLSSAVGKTVSVASESGRVMWSNENGSAAGVAASRGNVFLVDNKSNVHSLERSSGVEEWKTTEYEYRELTKPVFYLGDIVVGDYDGYIHILDGDSGKTVARQRMGKSGFYTYPIISSTTLIAYNKDGTLTAFEYSR